MSKMTRADILRIIDDHRAGLYALGVRELALFGSYARGDASDSSDVDILVDFDRKSFESYMLKSAIKPRLKETILREAIRAA